MCRFIAYTGESTLMEDFIFNAENSLVSQSKKSTMRVNPLNGDGFGVGWYPEHNDRIPGTFVSIEPAWSNRNLIQIASKIKTKHFFAHIRDASKDMPVSQSNCHPFQFGPYLWMHNGRLDQFTLFRRDILNDLSDEAFNYIKGNTDSECAFALFLDEINFDVNASQSILKKAMITTIEKIMRYRLLAGANTNAFINFAITNGDFTILTRFATVEGVRPASLFYFQDDSSTIVSSEPLSHSREHWIKVERNHLVCIAYTNITTEAIQLPFQSRLNQ